MSGTYLCQPVVEEEVLIARQDTAVASINRGGKKPYMVPEQDVAD